MVLKDTTQEGWTGSWRGRSGRQGDSGSSQFYVSLEDNLMRLFGSDRVVKVMDRMGLEEEVIQHSMMTNQ